MKFDEAIEDLKDELLLTDPEDAVVSVASAYQIDPIELSRLATRELGELSTFATRSRATNPDRDRIQAIADQVEAEAVRLGAKTSVKDEAEAGISDVLSSLLPKAAS